ncbi:MAG: CDP-alcohol phosphatidyltransferase family protein [Chloroflexi bacterium]|nr:CDP-alcohol phosphatidyltransferase family protein [Chloroflexota bacterium]
MLDRYALEPAARVLRALRVTPSAVTFLGLVLAAGAGALAGMGAFLPAALLLLGSGTCDLLDGALARLAHRASRFGAALDSTADRLGEAALFLGLLLFFHWQGSTLGVLLSALALVGSFLVSYLRARAEGLGVGGSETGLMTRPERVVVLVASLGLAQFVGPGAVLWGTAIVLALSLLTAGQRLYQVWGGTRTG